ncbi:unnamed protein product, partial [Amoebophrya sp. A120]
TNSPDSGDELTFSIKDEEDHKSKTNTTPRAACAPDLCRALAESWKLCHAFRRNVYPYVGASLLPNKGHEKMVFTAARRSQVCNAKVWY